MASRYYFCQAVKLTGPRPRHHELYGQDLGLDLAGSDPGPRLVGSVLKGSGIDLVLVLLGDALVNNTNILIRFDLIQFIWYDPIDLV